jgi:hypothetical protein
MYLGFSTTGPMYLYWIQEGVLPEMQICALQYLIIFYHLEKKIPSINHRAAVSN